MKDVNQKNIIIGIVYRPPDQNIVEFNNYVDKLLNKITGQENKLLFTMGDYNINLLNNDVHELVNLLTSYHHILCILV